MANYWCVNFDNDAWLSHGIENRCWMMGYQYAENEDDPPNRRAAITKNWRRAKEIKAGDRMVAYLKGQRFFATGTVITPRRPKTNRDRADSIEQYLERREPYQTGFIYFPPSVVYQNFTDECRESPVRIDVEGWANYVPGGVVVKVVGGIPVNEHQKAAFAIEKLDFNRIARELAAKHWSTDGPTSDELVNVAIQVNEEGYFSPSSFKDERKKRLREIVERRGQPDFRNKLIAAYGGRCAVSGCDAVAALEAAHILPYFGPQSNHVTNGLLLRADIHTLLDLDLIGIHPETLAIILAQSMKATAYSELEGQRLTQPSSAAHAPNQEVLVKRWNQFNGSNKAAE
ncbi:MAG TPA: HNH endonuclease [Gemmataceae bacterium]|nr:HNH endonuclease [Gemmataceae bacterium]